MAMAVLLGARPAFGQPWRSRRPGMASLLGAPLFALAASSLALAATAVFGAGGPAPAAAAPATPSSVALVGHGYGHGIGMGQWGSLGYALGADGGAGNFTYSQILTHYYGNTTLETLGTAGAPAASDGGNVRVAMTENNGANLIATAASGTLTVPGRHRFGHGGLLLPPTGLVDVQRLRGRAGRDLWRPMADDACRHQRDQPHGGRQQRRTGGTVPVGPQHRDARLAHRTGPVARAGPHHQHGAPRAVRGRRRTF